MNWSTFVLEIINFLVLIWILKRFLFKPVLDVIARRQAKIEKTLADAASLHAEAKKLEEQYKGRLADWRQEKQQAREALSLEFEAERSRKTKELQASLEKEREKARVAEERRQDEAIRKIEETAVVKGARFVTRLLEQASGPDTEARLVELVITELSQLSAERIADLQNNFGKTPEAVVVSSAFPLPNDQQRRLEQAIAKITSPNLPVRFEQNRKLLAGVRIIIGAWILGANLQDELKGFGDLTHEK